MKRKKPATAAVSPAAPVKQRGHNAVFILFFASALIILLASIYTSNRMEISAKMIEDSVQQRLLVTAQAAARLTTADVLDEFMHIEDMAKPGYQEIRNQLDAFTQQSGLVYTYFMRLTEDNQMQFIVDNVQDPADEPDGLDSEPVAREDGPDLALAGQPNVVNLGEYSIGWDDLMTAYAPVYYRDGSPSNVIVGVDIVDNNILAAHRNIRATALVMTISMVMVLLVSFFCLRVYHRKAKQSEIANEAKSSFLSRMSHEMRTPMNAVIGLCNMALNDNDLVTMKEHLGNINVSAQHLRRVIDDVLDISKIESGKMTLDFVPLLVAEELATIESMIRPQAEARGQQFMVELAENVPPAIYYDPVHTRQIVINLLSNAIKFTPEGGTISLQLRLLEQKENRCNLEWRIKDTGIGISAEDQERLFVPFEQVDVSTTRKYGGTGLGLAISRQLVEMMGGSIGVESVIGQGSTFVFNLWLDIAEPELTQAAHDQQQRNAPPDLSGQVILLVEDTEINQLVAADMLEQYGATVDIAANGQEGVKRYMADQDRYLMIFMDIQMPVMDGYEATRVIRESATARGQSIPIVAITANAFQEDIDRAFAAEMNGHIRKPLDTEAVEAVLWEILEQGQ